MEENVEKNNFKEWLKNNIILALVCTLVLGLIIGVAIMWFTNSTTIAKVGLKTITSKSIFKRMKNYYSIDLFLEDIDAKILNNKYKLTEDDLKELKDTANNYMTMYSTYYGMSEEEFLTQNGFKDIDEFVNYLSLDYKRTIYYNDYLETKLEPNAVEDYYNENAFGKVNTKHILVKTSDNMTDENAKAKAVEIIDKLNAGENFDEVAEEYTTNDPENIITEDLGEKGAFDRLEDSYIQGMKELNKGEYSTEPVKTSYGYHVIYCVDKVEKTEKISRKDRNAIIEKLAAQIMAEDSDLYTKVLIQMRKEAKLKFVDKDIKKKYDEYCEKYITEEDAEQVPSNTVVTNN